ncbi:Cell cycle protein GpsB [Clostridiales bacterium CHKCI006]|uniref:Cell division regulator GpsB n=1 Tax=Candidatus Fimiplasma intestinipullorum TaxID=2840825 RepID=A0A9D1HPU4_9FIRM|nr:Cell cycle protein GpsB [Clostridiales bacterium CHKCI006]HIU13294.1 cell division regulator GpsB [Candidatus Fimiplasma intestinipullorum]
MDNKLQLSPTKILNKEFKVDFKGYNATEVDYFLDVVIEDYETFKKLLNMAYEKIETLNSRNQKLKEQIQNLEKENALIKDQYNQLEENSTSNVDILKRLSLLEREVFKNR